MPGFTKLVPEIVQSSIWNQSSDIRIVWITLLALKDANGYVRGDVTTLARLANVSVEDASKAVDLFLATDPSSHTPDNDGRRIAPAPGGWLVLNHALYRTGDRNAYMADYMRKYRDRKKKEDGVKSVNTNINSPSASASVSSSVSDSSKKGDARGEQFEMNHYILTPRKEWVVSKGALPKRGTGGSAKRGTAPVSKEAHEGTPPRLSNEGTPSCDGFSLIPFIDIWKERFGACFETTTTAKRFKALSRTHGQSAAVEMFRLYVAGVDAKYASVNSFLQKPLAYTAKQAKGGEFPEDDMEVAHIC